MHLETFGWTVSHAWGKSMKLTIDSSMGPKGNEAVFSVSYCCILKRLCVFLWEWALLDRSIYQKLCRSECIIPVCIVIHWSHLQYTTILKLNAKPLENVPCSSYLSAKGEFMCLLFLKVDCSSSSRLPRYQSRSIKCISGLLSKTSRSWKLSAISCSSIWKKIIEYRCSSLQFSINETYLGTF